MRKTLRAIAQYLLCIFDRIFERLIHTRVEPITNPQLPREPAEYGRSIVDQIVLLKQNIEDSFEAKKKARVVFVDLTAFYDIVWHRGLTGKLLRLLPDKHKVWMILELIRNRSFTGDSKRSRLRHLRNGLPQGAVLAPSFLIPIYTIFPLQPPESMLMPMIWLCCIHLGT